MNYYEHHLGDWAKKTGALSMIEEGAYRRALDWYYINERPLPLKMAEVFRELRCHKKTEKDAISFVLRKFFRETDEGFLNERCEREIERFHGKSEKAKRSANARWARDAAESTPPAAPPESDANAYANASTESMRTQCEGNAPRARPQSPVTSNQSLGNLRTGVEKPKTGARGSRLPTDWQLPDEWAIWTRENAPGLRPAAVADQFRDFWHAKAGADATKVDWFATWRGWCRREHGRLPQQRAEHVPAWRQEQRSRTQQAAPYAASRPAAKTDLPTPLLFDEENHDHPRALPPPR